MKVDPEALLRRALKHGRLAQVLLGAPGYRYLPRYTMSAGHTDLPALLDVYYSLDNEYSRQELGKRLNEAIVTAMERYEGIVAAACCILCEVVTPDNKRLGLDLDGLAISLRGMIAYNALRLRSDKSGGGRNWPDGLLGDLRRLSRNTVERGGPPFCD